MRTGALVLILLYMMSCSNKKVEPTTEHESIDTLSSPEPTVEEEEPVNIKKTYPGWVEIEADAFTKIDIRYATKDNFVEEVLYPCGKCYVREAVGEGLAKVRQVLKEKNVGIILYDCYRPRPVQQHLWDKVPNPSYVTPPKRGSMHNRGVALDIGLISAEGDILDMGTEFDFFGREGHHDYYDHPQEVLDNRKLLKETMEQHGFASIRTEWWHYSFTKGSYELADWIWECD